MMDNKTVEPGIGSVTYASEVIATIAGLAASEIEGLSQMAGSSGIGEIFSGKKNPTKGVKVDLKDAEKVVSVNLNLVINFGVKIQETAWKIQENVKKTIEDMTDLKVTEVNIFVQGIDLDNKVKPE